MTGLILTQVRMNGDSLAVCHQAPQKLRTKATGSVYTHSCTVHRSQPLIIYFQNEIYLYWMDDMQ